MSDAPEKNNDPDSGALEPRGESENEQKEGLMHFVSSIKSTEQQIGEHVITALQHEGTVAVLTAVLPGAGAGERIASVPLDQELWQQVQELLLSAGEEKAQDVPCIGFQCVLRDRQIEADQQKKPETPPDNF